MISTKGVISKMGEYFRGWSAFTRYERLCPETLMIE